MDWSPSSLGILGTVSVVAHVSQVALCQAGILTAGLCQDILTNPWSLERGLCEVCQLLCTHMHVHAHTRTHMHTHMCSEKKHYHIYSLTNR